MDMLQNNSLPKVRERQDLTVEVFRIFGCLVVIGTHLKLGNTVDGIPVRSRVLVLYLLGDSVTVFWMILGFFHFSKALCGCC